MSKKCEIAIVVPVYNCEPYLKQCIDSVLDQTFKNIEVICINDGSTDNSLKVLEDFAQKDDRVTVISTPNQGVGKARNYGLEHCNSNYIRFLDADDWYPEKDTLEKMWNAAKKSGAKIIAGSICNYQDGEYKKSFSGDYADYVFEEEKLLSYKEFQYDFAHPRYMFDVEFLLKNNLKYPNYCMYEDPVFLVKAQVLAGELYVIPDFVYVHRLGYKTYKPWSDKQASDCIAGIKEIVEIAQENRLSKLLYLQISRLEGRYRKEMINNMHNKNDYVAKRLMEINEMLDVELLRECNPSFSNRHLLVPLCHFILESTQSKLENCEEENSTSKVRRFLKRVLPIKVVKVIQTLRL